MRSSPNERPESPLPPDEAREFGFAGEEHRWLEHAAAATASVRPAALGEYRILEEVSHGGQGVVYRALQPRTGREVALKLLLAGSFASEAARRRFEREVEIASSLDHPGVVTVYGLEEIDGVPVLAMEWVSGVTATEWARGAGLPEPRAARDVLAAFAEVCDAVSSAHQLGILHRDVKPSNVLVDDAGRPRVLDFGLAKSTDDTEQLTRSGGFVGTPGYASPEQMEGGRVDVRSDVFSLGVLLYEMLTGERPFRSDAGLVETLRAIERRDVARPSTLRRELDGDVDAIALRALAPLPADRYASVAGLAEDVRRALAHRPVLAHPPSTWYELRKLMRRNRPATSLTALLALLLVLFTASTVRQSIQLAAERNREAAARREAERAGAEARREYERAQTLLDFLVDDIFETVAGEATVAEVTVPQLLAHASEQARARFAAEPVLEATVHARIGRAYYFMERPLAAEAEARLALELLDARGADAAPVDAELAVSIAQTLGLVLMDLDRFAEAGEWLDRAVAGLESLADRPPGLLDLLRDSAAMAWTLARRPEEALAQTTPEVSEPEQARPETEFFRRLLVAKTLALGGDAERAHEAVRDVLGWTHERYGAESEAMGHALALAGEVMLRTQEHEAAVGFLRDALGVYHPLYGGEHERIAAVLAYLGDALVLPEQEAEAEACFREAVAIAERVLGPRSADTARYHLGYGQFLAERGRAAEAIVPLRAAVDAFEATTGPDAPRTRSTRLELAVALIAAGRHADAVEHCERLLAHHAAEDEPPPEPLVRIHADALERAGRAAADGASDAER